MKSIQLGKESFGLPERNRASAQTLSVNLSVKQDAVFQTFFYVWNTASFIAGRNFIHEKACFRRLFKATRIGIEPDDLRRDRAAL